MSFPKQSAIELPLLKTLHELGGQAKPRDIYPLVAKAFPDLTAADQNERLANSPGTKKWNNLVQWVRQALIDRGEIDGATRGIWKLTDAGRRRLDVSPRSKAAQSESRDITLRDATLQNADEVRKRIIVELNALSSEAFEKFCLVLLAELGYQDLTVTKRGPDGGIDGHGSFRQGVVSIRSAFQAKKWRANPVGRPEIDKLRGAIQGEYDHGVFITTNRFTEDALEASVRKGAITILLLDGNGIAALMMERGIGVRKELVYLMDVDEDFFKQDELAS